MKNLNTYITEKFKISKNIKIINSNYKEIISSLKDIFKDNDAFNENQNKIFELIKDTYENNFSYNSDYDDIRKYIICRLDYDDYDEYISKFKIDNKIFKILSNKENDNILNTYFKRNTKKEEKFKKRKHYFYIYFDMDYIWIDSGLKGNDFEDVLTICIVPEYEFNQ